VRIQHRHIIYVQGYDPRGLAQYYRMFRTELRKFGRLYSLSTTVGRPKVASDSETASWTVDTKDGDWQTRTDYDFLRWEDLIQPDLASPIWSRVFEATAIYWPLLFNGTFARLWKGHWRFATFISYPHLLLYFEALCAAGIAYLVGVFLDAVALPRIVTAAVSAAAFVGVITALLKYTEKRTYLLYLLSDTIFTWKFAKGPRPDWDQRIDRFAQYLVSVASNTTAQEIVVVGHSSGSFLSTEIMARALKLDPDLGRRGPRVALLTLGGNLPIVGFHSASKQFRDHLRLLAVEPSIDWIDGQSRKDVMNFHPFDPITGHGINAGADRRNPKIVSFRFREMIKPEHYNAFRWKFFRVHFQFVMASERPHPYDYFMIVCGPIPLRERIADPAGALAAVAGDAAARELA
jgi:pimeloyl-ACP methyl ester carboxylesterase